MTAPAEAGPDAIGSPLFHRTMAAEYPRPDDFALMRQVWEGTPWMVTAFTGSGGGSRFREIREWCAEHFGPEAWPIHGRPGAWNVGSATVFGETWIGFASADQMREFVAKWGEVPA